MTYPVTHLSHHRRDEIDNVPRRLRRPCTQRGRRAWRPRTPVHRPCLGGRYRCNKEKKMKDGPRGREGWVHRRPVLEILGDGLQYRCGGGRPITDLPLGIVRPSVDLVCTAQREYVFTPPPAREVIPSPVNGVITCGVGRLVVVSSRSW